MPLLSLLFIAAGVIVFVIDALIPHGARVNLQSLALALTTTGFALIFLMDDVDLVTF